MRVIRHITSTAVFLLCFIAISMICASCGNTSKKSRTSEKNQKGALIDEHIDIPVAINLSHPEEFDIAEYEVTRETDKDMYIDINSKYYKEYISGHRFIAPRIGYYDDSEIYENIEYLTLNLDIVNNTNKKLSINELEVVVNKSLPDTIPVIYICTPDTPNNCIYFINNSWFNWKGFTFSYSILSKDESFNGEYKNSRHIPFFENYTIIDFLPDMKEMGYEFDELVNCIKKRNIRHNRENNTNVDPNPLFIDEHNHYHLTFCLYDSKFVDDGDVGELDFFQEKFKPFELKSNSYIYEGIAKLYGNIKFDNSDFSVNFIADITLANDPAFGAWSYANDEFDVKLQSSGNDYKLRYPYTTVIEPYGTEMIELTVIADQSSSHDFHIDIKNDNGLKIRSKNIHFHHYYPQN